LQYRRSAVKLGAMKIIRFATEKEVKYGLLEGKNIQAIHGTPFRSLSPGNEKYKLNEVRLLSPCLPSKVVALGLNYRKHAEEMKEAAIANPLIFIKSSTSVIGPEDEIEYPAQSNRVDYEAELGVVIKKIAWQVPPDRWQEYVLGYTCVNDVTARDLQSKDGQWTRAKCFDTFCPIGPHIETDYDPRDVTVETYLNGEKKQSSSTSYLLHPIPELIVFISSIMTLLPGDVIATGTPEGIGPMHPGDTVEVKVGASAHCEIMW